MQQREIKFRIWRPTTKEMLYGNINWFISFDSDGTVNQGYVTAMLNTGLKDKTGKQAYEGDVVKRSHSSGKGYAYGVIVFLDGCFEVNWNNDEWNGITRLHLPESEIIGNIYEHPHLNS